MKAWTIESYIAWKQPAIFGLLRSLWRPAFADEELTPEQQYLDKLMRQRPRGWPL